MLVSLHILILLYTQIVSAWNSRGYTPARAKCPESNKLVRAATEVNPEELKWIDTRIKEAKPSLVEFLKRSGLDFNVESLLAETPGINIGQAISAGGYRSMLVSAGTFMAMDDRIAGTDEKNHLGGLLQASTYMTGVSTGSWLVGTLALNNFTTIRGVLKDRRLWNLQSIVHASSALEIIDQYGTLATEVLAKLTAGWSISMTDVWGRLISTQLISGDYGLPQMEWSDIQDAKWFQDHSMPFPIILSNARHEGRIRLSIEESTVLETTPYEFGSFDPSLYGFMRLEYLGTRMNNGEIYKGTKCYRGFDNAGYMLASSSSAFNQYIVRIFGSMSGTVGDLLRHLIRMASTTTGIDVANYYPNPFERYVPPEEDSENSAKSAGITKGRTLTVVDGSEDGQGIPLQPLIHKDRKVDVIFAHDSTSETKLGWPMGKSMIKSKNKAKMVQMDVKKPTTIFPKVPGNANTWINLGLTQGPKFFGCKKPEVDRPHPLIIYMPNYPYSVLTNTSDFQLTYGFKQMFSLIRNGYDSMTQLNGTRPGYEDWQTCVACAILQREIQRQSKQNSKVCQACLTKYCWDEETSNTTDARKSPNYYPTVIQPQFPKKTKGKTR